MAEFFSKIKSALLFLIVLYLFPLLLLGWVVFYHDKTGIPLHNFTWDPAMFKGIRPFYSIVSTIGILFWCSTVVICLFSWFVRRKWVLTRKDNLFLLYSGLLTAFLMLDDIFEIHEFLGSRGFHETYFYRAYLLVVAAIFLYYWKTILRSEYPLLLFAGGLFVIAILLDVYQDRLDDIYGDWSIFAEDGFKLLGIVGWFGYYLRTCYAAMKQPDQPIQED